MYSYQRSNTFAFVWCSSGNEGIHSEFVRVHHRRRSTTIDSPIPFTRATRNIEAALDTDRDESPVHINPVALPADM